MALAVGPITLVSKTTTTINLSCVAGQGGTGPYTYQWYRSTVSGFTPSVSNDLPGETALTLADTGLTAGTNYFYAVVVTDTGDSNATAQSTQFSTTTSSNAPNPNQFAQTTQVGVLDQRFNFNTIAVQVSSDASDCYPGTAVKVVDSAGGVIKVKPCDADTDNVLGFINYNNKNTSFPAGANCEVSAGGNVIYLYATEAIARGIFVTLDVTAVGGVKASTGSSADRIVGWAFDKATAAGDIIRVYLQTPSTILDS